MAIKNQKNFQSIVMKIKSVEMLNVVTRDMLEFQSCFEKKIPPQELTTYWKENEIREMQIDIYSVDLLFSVKWKPTERGDELYLAGRQIINGIPIYFECHGYLLDSSGSDSDDSGCDSDFRWREKYSSSEYPRHEIFGDILFSKFPQNFLRNCDGSDCFKERVYCFLQKPFTRKEEEEHTCQLCEESKKDKLYPRFHQKIFCDDDEDDDDDD